MKLLIDKDICIAKTMPARFYLEDDYFSQSVHKIFKHSWQFITDHKTLKNIFPFKFLEDLIGEPLIICKNKGEINCYSNVCTHRGNILCDSHINTKAIQCKYHGRTFDLNGKIKYMPGFSNVKNFPSKDDNLKKVKIKKWNNFIFSSIKGGININNVLDDISQRLIEFPFDNLTFDRKTSTTYTINAHWALYCENYLEGFHVPYVHKGLNNDVNLNTYETVLLDNGVLQLVKEKNENNNKNIVVYAYYYWIFPNIMINIYDWGISINIIEPINKTKTKIRFLSYPLKGYKQPTSTDASLDVVEKEDQKIVTKVQEGIQSSFYNRGRYSVEHEQGVHYFHRLLSNYIN